MNDPLCIIEALLHNEFRDFVEKPDVDIYEVVMDT